MGREGNAAAGRPEYRYTPKGLKPVPYEQLGLDRPWQEYDIRHALTDKGMEKFSADWKSLIQYGRDGR